MLGGGFGPAVLFDIVIGRKRNVDGFALAGLALRGAGLRETSDGHVSLEYHPLGPVGRDDRWG